ncbi:DUF2771 family protein [Actinophytocola xanthii]|uniref:DUF2771 family protein n=1 Tax=Actinophytocola xanthii TaxID=1912961 RepID=UPI0009F8DDA5|nr:DUF2771 family protein [Actinophytocola xanthii]
MRTVAVPMTLVLLLAGCSSTPPPPADPSIDFSVADTKVSAKPYLYCDIEVNACKRDNTAQVRLTVAPGTPVRVRVPKEVAETPWSVVIQYRTAAGEQKAPETVATFAPNKASTFDALPPGKGDQLQTVEVKQAGAKLVRDEAGEPAAVSRGVWSARIEAPA